jgi:hypothetical protein
MEWLKVKAQNSSPSIAKKKKGRINKTKENTQEITNELPVKIRVFLFFYKERMEC